MMGKRQEVGKGHIEPAIYITPYSEREEKHTHKQRSDRRHSGVCIAKHFRTPWQDRGGNETNSHLAIKRKEVFHA